MHKRFSSTELKHIVIAWAALSVAFGIALSGLESFAVVLRGILLAAITAGVGFIGHELMHKALAQRYHCFAEFRADFKMLLFALALSFTGFLFAAPGAVVIYGRITKEQSGKISIAGPIANLVIALLFALLGYLVPSASEISRFGYSINAWLGLFNLIPFGMFDGGKVYAWSKPWYFGTLFVASIMVFAFFALGL